jgi:hypothetical protein
MIGLLLLMHVSRELQFKAYDTIFWYHMVYTSFCPSWKFYQKIFKSIWYHMSIVVGFTCKISSKSEILNQLLKVKSNSKDLCCWSAVGGHVRGRKFSSVKVGFRRNILRIRVILTVTLSSGSLWACFHALSPLLLVSAK